MNPNEERAAALGRDHGFDLRGVSWGYRDVFATIIAGLHDEGYLGAGRETVTKDFYKLLADADQSCYDHVLKEFLTALRPETRWILDLPAIFSEVVELGRDLAAARLYCGLAYFHVLGGSGLGRTPAEMRRALTWGRRLLVVDPQLATAFLQGYAAIRDRLTPEEIERFLAEGLRIAAGGGEAGERFLRAESQAAESVLRALSRECALEEVRHELAPLLRGLTDQDFEIGDLGQLDADDLIERGSRVIALYRWIYLPSRVRIFDQPTRNRAWYRLCAVASAALFEARCFPCIHGHREFPDLRALVGEEPLQLQLATMLELARGLRWLRRTWPGARSLLDFGLATELKERPPIDEAERLLADLLAPRPATQSALDLLRVADMLANPFDTAEALRAEPLASLAAVLAERVPALRVRLPRALAFLPDFLYPCTAGTAPPDQWVADLKEESRRRRAAASEQPPATAALAEHPSGDEALAEGDEESAPIARYWYPEWNQAEARYYEPWCGVREARPEPASGHEPSPEVARVTARVRHYFERMRPVLARKERRLEEGDAIDLERLVDHRVQRRLDPDPAVDFYEKHRPRRRDLAVLLLLDVSGSTGEGGQQAKVLDLERGAAWVLGAGLDALGDAFAVMGYHSNGREDCVVDCFKDFEEPWSPAARARLASAYPRGSTRLGAGIRHAGYRLRAREARQRLLILITDGKPMDAGYDPRTRHAQFDVRRACVENEREGVVCIAISTEANTGADMELMFPRRRFVVLPDLRRLPRLLPRLYVSWTH